MLERLLYLPDGDTPEVGMRIGVLNQADSTQNGFYTLTTAGDAVSVNWVLTRATDFDQAADVVIGAFASILSGDTLAGFTFVQTSDHVIMGTTAINFALPSAANITGNGLVGELLQSALASGDAVSLSNGVNTVITSIPYTAGKWRVTANPRFVYAGITNTATVVFCGTSAGDNQTGATAYNTNHIEHPGTGASGTAGSALSFTFRPTTSGTLYLKILPTFSAGTATAFGAMEMERTG